MFQKCPLYPKRHRLLIRSLGRTLAGGALMLACTGLMAQSPVVSPRPGFGVAPPAAKRAPAATVSPSGARMLDRVVAVVNDEAITSNELNARLAAVESQLRRQNIALPPREVFERQVLERMIVDRAQLQLARDTAIRVDDLQLDRAIGRIAEQNNLSVQQFRDRLEREGIAFTRFREDIREEIIMQRLREREVDSRIQVSEGEIDVFLAEQGVGNPSASEYLIEQILIRVPEQASPEQIDAQRRRAEQVMGELRAGGDFLRASASYSDAPDALTGGSLGWRNGERLPQLFLDAVSNLQPGTVAGPLKSPNGFHILRLVDRRSASGGSSAASRLAAEPVTQTRARHILIKVNELVSEQEARRRLTELRERLINRNADFGELARQFSRDDGTAQRGGELGWVYAGDTVPEFERAMNALKPGEISEPIQSPFGWHLIQVQDRRKEEMSSERMRQAARGALRERKLDDAYQEWLRQLRDRSFVEVRLEES